MKANKVPEKIYVHVKDGKALNTWNKEWIGVNDIEYTRTDAFIEKASELLVNCIEDFMIRRMEIWDEECKKQTLENLRNALKE